MPRDSNGVYTLPEALFQPNTVAQPGPVNNNFSDVATALTNSLTRGETTAFTRTLLDDPDAAAARTTLGATATGGAVFTAADAAAARTTLDVPLRPSDPIWSSIALGENVAAVLPAGGTWAYRVEGWNTNGTSRFETFSAVRAGGTTVGAATVGVRWVIHVWRIA